ncbi:DUF4129 domain-containing protein [Nocardioides conyzicola]|uniref:Protein-glutamine gamma-glutamyltransferase-like C-terminal domain-containing protein n=1 Tax=Nocardioides conyzicola TaxID=1651781 RepID=A0ABP8WPH2_9ACTN
MTARRSGTLAVALVAVGVLLGVVLVTWAASIGPNDVIRGDGPSLATPTDQPSQSATPQGDTDPVPRPHDAGAHAGWIRVIAVLLNVAAVVLVVALLVWLVRWLLAVRRVRRDRASRSVRLESAFDVVDPGAAVARELLAGIDAQRAALTGGSPRNAVVACWHRFELAAAAAGVERRAWETSSEHTIRVLDLVDADPAAVSRLAGLYREARFSQHELTEDDRTAALEALDRIHRTVHGPVTA